MPGWVESDPVPPGHGEPGEGAARPAVEAECWCGRPLNVLQPKPGQRGPVVRSCTEHGVQQVMSETGWQPAERSE